VRPSSIQDKRAKTSGPGQAGQDRRARIATRGGGPPWTRPEAGC